MELMTALLLSLLAFASERFTDRDQNWPEYNGDGARSHYSPLTQINADNLPRLKPAWIYKSGGADTVRNRTQMQCNPIIVDGKLYGVSAGTQAFALDAATGKELWKSTLTAQGGTTSRGLAYWADHQTSRLFFGNGQYLYALNPHNGEPITSFGVNGRIDIAKGLERPGADDYIRINTPVTVYKNLLIVGTRVSETETAALGDARAYDARSGKLVWTFRTIPARNEPGYGSWGRPDPRIHIGGANAWAGMAIDRERGMVFIPTGSAAYDFYGGNRKGDNLYANCLLALDAATGKKRWHFQFVHHDIWDRDPPCPPNLLTITRKGKKIDVVAQVTKQGWTFVFNRENGQPIFPVHEKSFPTDCITGEYVSPTQPVPDLPEPFTRQSFSERDLNSFVIDKDSVIQLVSRARTGSAYMPITSVKTIFFPGTDGGAQWGGAATDRDGVLYVPAKEIPVYTSLAPRETAKSGKSSGSLLYARNCAMCHGNDRAGNHDGSYPSLLGVGSKMSDTQIQKILLTGRGMMPSFGHLDDVSRKAIIQFLQGKETTVSRKSQESEIPYQHTGYNRWYDRNGYPVSAPPWGTLTAIDINSGKRRWQVPLGEYPELTEKGIDPTGTDNYGGPLITASGLIFIAASRDEMFRIFESRTGKLLWKASLPAAGYASPSTYSVGGKQYVVIACGGGKLNTKSGDQFVAFALE